MRRKVGVSVVQNRQVEREKFNKLGKSLEDMKLSFVQDVLKKFEGSLFEFATKHKDRINSDPEFRHQFHKMCLSVGVDPLASNKGFWANVLGVGNFYYDLGTRIIEISVQSRAINGGIISLTELITRLRQNKSLKHILISREDVLRAIEKISVLGNGFKIVKMSGFQMVVSVPMEINVDHQTLLENANEDGSFTQEMICLGLGWTKERFEVILNPLLAEGMVWMDCDHKGKISYYFPSLWKQNLIPKNIEEDILS